MTNPSHPSPRAAAIHRIVRERGYVGELEPAGSVLFKVEGKLYRIPDDRDQAFIRIIHQQVRTVRSEAERPLLEAAAVLACGTTKVAKIYVTEVEVLPVVEIFCSPVDRFAAIFDRSIAVLNYIVQEFQKHLKAVEQGRPRWQQ